MSMDTFETLVLLLALIYAIVRFLYHVLAQNKIWTYVWMAIIGWVVVVFTITFVK